MTSTNNTAPQTDALAARNRRLGLIVLGVVAGMVALSFAAVPFYNLFCRVTGFGGTTQTAITAPAQGEIVTARTMTVRLNTDVSPRLPWAFAPDIRSVALHPGQEALVSFSALNKSDKPVTGTAVYNVTPVRAGKYFFKTQCFCFDRQTLNPGEEVHMPVSFFIDPDMMTDPDMADVTDITLSYTFFVSDSQELEKASEDFYNRPE